MGGKGWLSGDFNFGVVVSLFATGVVVDVDEGRNERVFR